MSHPPSRAAALTQSRAALGFAGAGAEHLTARVHELHRAISDLPFQALAPLPGVGPVSDGVRFVHDGITDAVYRCVGVSLKLGFAATGRALRTLEGPRAELSPQPLRDSVASAVAGLYGDDMAVRRNPLTPRMRIYHCARPLALNAEALRDALPQATPRLAIFVHGLACNEASWDLYRETDDGPSLPYPERLQAAGFTSLRLRYNTGLHISRNGARLARLIERLSARYPGALDEIVLVGHSMGGLVARAAAAAALARGDRWVNQLSTVICLGSPHRGAPLEQWVHQSARWMSALPLTRPLGRFLEARSVGIKDLGQGYVQDADWRGQHADVDVGRLCSPIPRPAHTRYHFIGASLGSRSDDPRGAALGDGLVRLPSATAVELADADSAVLFRTHHMRLLNHPVVAALIEQALVRPPLGGGRAQG